MSNREELLKTTDENALQTSLGMMRVAELQALVQVAKLINACGYVSMGSGRGYDFHTFKAFDFKIPALGFDIVEAYPESLYESVQVHCEPIFVNDKFLSFTESVAIKIENFVTDKTGPVLFYTDNGRKLQELKLLLPYLKTGDVIGTHDWGEERLTRVGTYTEVPEASMGFMYDAGLEHYQEIDPWLETHRCIQKFWIKP